MYIIETASDPRWQKLAVVFCRATQVKEGDKVLLNGIGYEAWPFIRALHAEALRLGAAAVDAKFHDPQMGRYFLEVATDEQLAYFPQWDLDQMKKMDVFMAARARTNSLYLKGIPGDRISQRQKVTEAILNERVNNSRWCITYVPTDGDAALAGMSTEEYLDFFFNAAIQNYAAMKENQAVLVDLMNQTDQVKIIGSGTELTFSIKGIGAVSCHGEKNIPDGEVYTAPVRDSVNGKIHYDAPTVYQGREWTNVRLQFKDGKIVEANCDQGADELNKVFDTDEGARYVGEFAIGTNPGITRPAKNILFDEKIFGSIHFTPGRAYEDADNGNTSAIHWDLVKLMGSGSAVYFDDRPIMTGGRFVYRPLTLMNP